MADAGVAGGGFGTAANAAEPEVVREPASPIVIAPKRALTDRLAALLVDGNRGFTTAACAGRYFARWRIERGRRVSGNRYQVSFLPSMETRYSAHRERLAVGLTVILAL